MHHGLGSRFRNGSYDAVPRHDTEIINRPTESDQKFIYFATESTKTISDLPSFVSYLSPKRKRKHKQRDQPAKDKKKQERAIGKETKTRTGKS